MKRRKFLGVFGGAVTIPFFTWKRGEEVLIQEDQILIPHVQQVPPQVWIDDVPVKDLLEASLGATHPRRYRKGRTDGVLDLTALFEDIPGNDLPTWIEESHNVWHNIRLHLGSEKWQMRGIVTHVSIYNPTAPLTKVGAVFSTEHTTKV